MERVGKRGFVCGVLFLCASGSMRRSGTVVYRLGGVPPAHYEGMGFAL